MINIYLLFAFLASRGWAETMDANEVPIPNIPYKKLNSQGIDSFVRLWEFSVQEDGTNSGGVLRTSDIKTLLVPTDTSILGLIQQDAPHPLYLDKHKTLRREYLLNHLVQRTVTNQDVGNILQTENLLGKEIFIFRDQTGRTWVNNATVLSVRRLLGGLSIFVISKPLFDMAAKIRQASEGKIPGLQHPEGTGPPLDIPDLTGGFVQPPAPPPPGNPIHLPRPFGPPAPPPPGIGINQPPSPPQNDFPRPPAPPENDFSRPPAPPMS